MPFRNEVEVATIFSAPVAFELPMEIAFASVIETFEPVKFTAPVKSFEAFVSAMAFDPALTVEAPPTVIGPLCVTGPPLVSDNAPPTVDAARLMPPALPLTRLTAPVVFAATLVLPLKLFPVLLSVIGPLPALITITAGALPENAADCVTAPFALIVRLDAFGPPPPPPWMMNELASVIATTPDVPRSTDPVKSLPGLIKVNGPPPVESKVAWPAPTA